MSNNETYMFMSQPRAVDAARKKFRDPVEDEEGYDNTSNLMYDPRVIRGITCVGPDMLKTQVMEEKVQVRDYETRKQQLIAAGRIRPTYDSVAKIHENIEVPKVRTEVPLHLYLLEQEEKTMVVAQDTQTDVFLEEPPAPAFIPKKTGVDMETQVENEIVFNYDIDVMPILQVVISKTVEQSLMEVRQEEELRDVSRKRENLEKKARMRAEEAAKLEKTEKNALRLKEQLLLESRQRHKREVSMQKKLASNVFAAKYLANLQEMVFTELEEANYLSNPTRMNAEEFMPWLTASVEKNVEGVKGGESWMEMVLSKTLRVIQEEQEKVKLARKEAAAAALAAAEEAERKRLEDIQRMSQMELYIHSETIDKPVGPIALTGNSTIGSLREKISEWMSENMDEPPAPEAVSFMYDGKIVEDSSVLFDLGLQNLGTIQMLIG